MKTKQDILTEIWQQAFMARAMIVIQPRCLVYNAEQCAKFADEAVEEAIKRL